MSKRSQTTGIPKSRKATQEAQQVEKTRAQREAEIQRRIIIGTGITIGVIVFILIAALVSELLIVPNQTVATVNGDTISVAQFRERVRFERALLNQEINSYISLLTSLGQDPNQFAGQDPLRTWLSEIQIPDQLGQRVLNDMVSETLIRQQAAERGITASAEQIDARINQFLGFNPETIGVDPTPTLTPTITPTPFVSPTPAPTATASPAPTEDPEATEEAGAEATAEVEGEATATPFPTIQPTATQTVDEQIAQFNRQRDEFFAALRREANVGQDVINRYFEAQALRVALRDDVTADITDEPLHANSRHILVATEEEALDVLAALEAGESFAQLAQSISIDTGSGSRGGELGWAPVNNFVPPFAEAVATGEIGPILGPVQSEFGWHIIQVRARENRPVAETALNNLREQEFANWLDELRTAESTSVDISPIWVDHVPDEPPFILRG